MSKMNPENFRSNPQAETPELDQPALTTELAQTDSSNPLSSEKKPLSFLHAKGLVRNTEKGLHFDILTLTKLAYDLNTIEERRIFTENAVRDLYAAYKDGNITMTAYRTGIAHLKRVPVIGTGAVALALEEIKKENDDEPSVLAPLPVENENAITKLSSYLPVTIRSPRQAQRILNRLNFKVGPHSHHTRGEITESLEMLTEFLATATTAPNIEEVYEQLCKKFPNGIPTRFYEVLTEESAQNGTILELLRYICKAEGLRVLGHEQELLTEEDQDGSNTSVFVSPEETDEDEDDLYVVEDHNDIYTDGTPRKKRAIKIGTGDVLSDTHRQKARDNWEF